MNEERLDDETENLMWDYRRAGRQAETEKAQNNLRSRIRTLVEEAKTSGRHEMWVESRLNTRGVG